VRRRRSARAGVRALDAEHVRSTRALARVLSTVRPERDPLIRDPAVKEDARLALGRPSLALGFLSGIQSSEDLPRAAPNIAEARIAGKRTASIRHI
jgi:hypothetical protein